MLRILRALYHAALVFADFAEFSPDLTLCHFAGNRALLGLLLSCMVGKPYVMVMHAADVWNRPPGLSVLVRNAKEVWTISDYNKRYLTEHYADINWNNLRVVRMGVDLVRLPFRMNRPADSRQILFVGRLVPMKGADILIRACAMLHQRGYAFQLFVIGDGPQHRYLQGLARDLGIGHIVHFLGSQPVDIVYDRLLQASVFALPCRIANDKEVMDGIPVALIEAMASGTPVISTPVSGVPELIQNGRNGLLVEPENVEELCDAICCLWQMDPEHLNYLIKQARETVEGLHDIRSTVDEIIRAAKTDSPEESQNILAVG
jgi:glycosyltransferase involved in cell wall biosynthesis